MAEAGRYKKNPDVSWRTIEGQAVLVFNKEGEVQVLNEVGTYVWEHAEEGQEALVQSIVQLYDVPPDVAAKDVEEFLASLLSSGALQPV